MKTRALVAISLVVAAIALVSIIGTAAANAPAGRYTVSGGSVLDNKTGLIWQQTMPTATMSWADAKTYCAGLGATLGSANWRLPTIKELLTIVDTTQSAGPFLDPIAFPGKMPTFVWSASPVVSTPTYAWTLYDGGTGTVAMVESIAVRCVR
jgi:hypothetical protein